ILLLVTGFASIWSRYRLSKIPELIANDWQVGPDVRYQHHLGTFFAGTPYQVHFYMPIGLMNTHLTYAGLLMLAFPYLLLRVVDPFVRAPRALLKPNMIVPLLSLAVLLILMVLNNGRSALLGMGVAALVGMYFFIRHYWKWKVVRLLPILGVALLSFGVLVHFSDSMHYRFARIMNALTGESKHTDHQRTLVWNGTFELIQAHPFIGVGAGNFEKNIIQHVGTFGQEHPRLWIPYALAQRGHAHSDIFHLFAIGGPLSAGFYLLFFGLLMYHLTDAGGLNRNGYLRWAPIGMLFAGLLQCYFQDDEVLLPFWIYTGLILGGIRNHTSASETMNDKSDMGPAD
ncbi:MAG: O-antigen ligase family protein, partial [Leptospiraceae bacterium]|nr:O-antigen ligase family protein [Leptospiraceae bacterium]